MHNKSEISITIRRIYINYAGIYRFYVANMIIIGFFLSPFDVIFRCRQRLPLVSTHAEFILLNWYYFAHFLIKSGGYYLSLINNGTMNLFLTLSDSANLNWINEIVVTDSEYSFTTHSQLWLIQCFWLSETFTFCFKATRFALFVPSTAN